MKNIVLTLSFALSITTLFSQGPGCPSIEISSYQGPGLNSITLPCDSSCVSLSANAFAIAQTSSYTVSSLPWNGLPYSTSSGVGFASEDNWSNVLNLPFNFCYFGASYNQLIASPNGALSFFISNAGQQHSYTLPANQFIPSLGYAFTPNTIFGAVHDMNTDCSGWDIKFGVQGAFPCRAFVFSFSNVPHYKPATWPWDDNCSSQRTTQQIVLYEGTNVIEIYLQNKPIESSWYGGRAVVGIQNAAGDVGYAPPGRNNGTWSASNEAWRFSPSGAPAYTITWHEGNITNPAIGTGPNFTACPSTQFTSYSALLTYTNCANEVNQFWSTVDVNLSGPVAPQFTSNSPVCETQTLTLDGPTVAGATYFWSGPGGWTSNLENPTIPGATAAASGTYNLYVVVAGCTSSIVTQQILVVGAASTPPFTTNSPVCAGEPIQLTTGPQPGAIYHWSGPNGFTSNLQNPTIPATPAAAGNYTLFIELSGCNSGTSQQNVVVNPTPPTPNFTVNSPLCTLEDIVFDGPSIPGATYAWTGPGGWTSSVEDPTRPNASIGMSGTYNLTITVNGCVSASASQNIVVNGSNAPTFSSNAPICGGQDLNLSANPIVGATYVWSGPGGFNPGNIQNPTITGATAAQSGTYSLYVVVAGCTSAVESQNIAIAPIIIPPMNSNSPICAGDTLKLSSLSIDSLAGFHWTGPNGWVDSTTSSPVIPNATVNMSGDYHLYIGSNGCISDTATITVVVNPIPVAPTISSNSPVCEGNALNLNGPTIAGATYNWSGPNGYVSHAEDSVLSSSTLNMAGTYQLTVSVAGCESPASSLNVVINDSPNVTTDVDPTTVCQGSLVNFDATVTVQPPSVILGSAWDVQGDAIPDYLTPLATHIYSAPGNYNATFATIGTGNCTTIVTVPIIVNPKPNATYTGPTANCGTLVPLTSTAQVNAPASIANYAWFFNGAPIGAGQNLTHDFNANPFEQVNGYVIASTNDGCLDTATYSIALQPTPIANFIVDECVGLSVPFDNTTSWVGTPAPGTTLSYLWLFGDGQTGSAEEPTHTYPNSGTYVVTLVATSSAFNCTDSAMAEIIVSVEPEVQITAIPECFQNVNFTSQVNAFGSNITQYNWDLGTANGTSADSAFIYEYQNAGAYTVTLTVTNEENCSTTVSTGVIVLPSVTLSELEIPNILTPNGDGTNDEFKLDPQFDTCNEYELLLFNRWGNVVFKQTKGSTPFRGYSQDGKTKLSTGVYFYTIKAGSLNKNGTVTIAY